MWGALIGAGASLIGGALNRNAQSKANSRQEYLNSPAGIRAESEKAGFNPLVFAGAAGSFGSNGPAPSMGSAIANAGMAVSDALTNEEQLKIQKGQLELDNRRLNAQIEAATLRPQVAGIYGSRSGGSGGSGDPSSQTDRVRSVDALYSDDDPERLANRDLPMGEKVKFDVNENYAPAQNIEDEYGDAVSWFYGAGKAAADIGRAFYNSPGIQARLNGDQNPASETIASNERLREAIAATTNIDPSIVNAFRADMGLPPIGSPSTSGLYHNYPY